MSQPAKVGSLIAIARESEADPGPRLLPDVPADFDKPERAIVPTIPRRFQSVTLDGFRPEHAKQKRALAVTQRFVDTAVQCEGEILALIGPAGCGKSHLLYAAARALHERGVDVECRSWYTLADEIRYGDGKLEAHEVRRRIFGAGALMLDEVRPTANTEFDDTELTKIICHAWDNRRPVMLTTNVNPLDRLVGSHVVSRITAVIVEGEDWRKKRGAA